MKRCLLLAQLGAGKVAPNPLVGAVLVYNESIIGEGWHKVFGGPHAEVNCFNAVKPGDRSLISQSTLYVSLEPCAHYGKTPPCSLRIIQEGVKKVVIGISDPFSKVNGLGIQQLKEAGVDVEVGVLQNECVFRQRRFLHFFTQNRPYVHLKWAKTRDGFMASEEGQPRMMITNPTTARLVHKWRFEEGAVLIGSRTALKDNPYLDTRFWNHQPIKKILIDSNLEVPVNSHLFNPDSEVWVFNRLKNGKEGNIHFIQLDLGKQHAMEEVLKILYSLNIQSILVEGGAATIRSFIEAGIWNEAHILTHTKMMAGVGLKAPELISGLLKQRDCIGDDSIASYFNS